MRSVFVSTLLIALTACGGGGSAGSTNFSAVNSPPTSSSPAGEATGGYWIGTDSDNFPVAILASDEGVFYFTDGQFDKATGIFEARSGNYVRAIFQKAHDPNFPIPPSLSRLAYCNLSGTIVARESMTLDVRCRDSQQIEVFTTLSLSNDALYARGSSLDDVAGNFAFNIGGVLSIGEDGSFVSQDATSGCMSHGQITLLDHNYNVYGVEITFTDCSAVNPVADTRVMNGLAMLDDTGDGDRLILAVSIDIEGRLISIAGSASRL